MKKDNIPDHVREEMRLSDINPDWNMPAGLLYAIEQACKFDHKLVDDPHGISVLDKLTLTGDEQRKRRPRRKEPNTWAEKIEQERHAHGEHHHDEPPAHLAI